MKTDGGIISRFDPPKGYTIRAGKLAWSGLCICLDLLAGWLSQVSSPDDQRLSWLVIGIFAVPTFFTASYFHTFRDKLRWGVAVVHLITSLFVIEMILRVWLGFRVL